MKKIFISMSVVILLTSCMKGGAPVPYGNDGIEASPVQENNTVITEVQDVDTLESLVSKIKKSYLKNPEFNSCSTQAVSLCLQNEISKNIHKDLDENFCDDYLDESSQKSCIQSIRMQVAIKSGDIKKCDSLEGGKLSCAASIMREQALKAKDVEFCSEIGDASSEEIHQEINRCRSDISAQLARETLDVKYCDNLSEDFEKRICTEDIEQQVRFEEERKKLEKQYQER